MLKTFRIIKLPVRRLPLRLRGDSRKPSREGLPKVSPLAFFVSSAEFFAFEDVRVCATDLSLEL